MQPRSVTKNHISVKFSYICFYFELDYVQDFSLLVLFENGEKTRKKEGDARNLSG